MLVDAGARRLRGYRQGGRELAVVDLMIFRAEHRARELAGQMRLAPSRFRSRNAMQRQLELLLELGVMKEPRLVIGRRRRGPPPPRAPAHERAGTRSCSSRPNRAPGPRAPH